MIEKNACDCSCLVLWHLNLYLFFPMYLDFVVQGTYLNDITYGFINELLKDGTVNKTFTCQNMNKQKSTTLIWSPSFETLDRSFLTILRSC